MKKVYAIVADRNSLDVALIMVCEDLDDAKDLVDMWGEDYEILEIPFIEKSKEYEKLNYPFYRTSTDVEPQTMPFVGKSATVAADKSPIV